MPPEMTEISEWLRKADHDRRMSEAGLAQTPPITDGAAFHCQQAAEKLLKAFLTWSAQDFERTHDLRSLIELCARHDPAFLEQQEAVEPLTAYAVRFRYPGPTDPTVDEVRSALAVVQELWRFVCDKLPTEVQP